MGGRGAGYNTPNGNGKGNFSPFSLGTKVASTLKEALGKKGKPIEMGKAYKDANPNYDPSGSYDEYIMNCQRCVVTNEARRRGYDVTAQPTYEGDKLPEGYLVGDRKFGQWMKAFRHAKPVSVKAKTSQGVVKNIQDKMKSYGEGSRGVVAITYKGRNFGHVFNVEQRKGTTYFIDAQSGERIRAKQFFDITDKSTVTLTRVDNLRLSEKAKEFFTAENTYKRKKK